jgi:dienelactone hydrolase
MVLKLLAMMLVPVVISAGGRLDSKTAILQGGDPGSLFAYDAARTFDVKEISSQVQDGAVVRDLDYAAYSSQRGRIKAFLVQPQQGDGPFAGILFFHWLGRPKGDRTQFLDEAIALARQGTVSLLIQGYFPWQAKPEDGKTDRQRVIDETVEVRHALDLLLSQTNVDSTRIGYVGHDYGAMYGSLVAGVDKRIKTYVLIAGIGSFADWSLEYWLKAKPDEFKESYRQAFKPLEPVVLVKQAAPSAILFQFANTDKYISKAAAGTLYDAASQPKEIRWYETTHEMNVEAASNDRRKWLAEKLGLKRG